MGYRVVVRMKEVRGRCAMGYQPGGALVERFYTKEAGKGTCLHALAAMLTLPAPLLKGAPATALGIGKEDSVGYAQYPDPREPYTCGGTEAFELKREKAGEG